MRNFLLLLCITQSSDLPVSMKTELLSEESCIYYQRHQISGIRGPLHAPFFPHLLLQDITFAGSFWVLSELVIFTPSSPIQLVLEKLYSQQRIYWFTKKSNSAA